MIHVALITDAMLAKLVCEHRDNAGRAHRIVQRPADAQNYADRQNGMADLYQELLDHRRASLNLNAPLTNPEEEHHARKENRRSGETANSG